MSLNRPVRITVAAIATAGLSFLLLTPDPLALLGLTSWHSPRSVAHGIPDSVQHAVSYALFTVLLVIALGTPTRRTYLVAGMLALGHGIATEFLQRYVPDRTSDWGDLAADAIGIGAGLLLIIPLAPRLCGGRGAGG